MHHNHRFLIQLRGDCALFMYEMAVDYCSSSYDAIIKVGAPVKQF